MIINDLKHSKLSQASPQDGFTIIELMIATAVLTIILLIASVTIINIGDLYGKGVSQSDIQTTERDDINQISQSLQFSTGVVESLPTPIQAKNTSGQTINTTVQAICIGSDQYTFAENVQIGDNIVGGGTFSNVFLKNASPSDFNENGTLIVCPPANLTTYFSAGNGLVGGHMEVHNFSVSTTSPYTLTLDLTYGDDDLLNNSGPGPATCSGGTGDQFCATSNLTTTVAQRLEP
jgi:prepilin-type N-terminal cleavage/methylation domain-containing protein